MLTMTIKSILTFTFTVAIPFYLTPKLLPAEFSWISRTVSSSSTILFMVPTASLISKVAKLVSTLSIRKST